MPGKTAEKIPLVVFDRGECAVRLKEPEQTSDVLSLKEGLVVSEYHLSIQAI